MSATPTPHITHQIHGMKPSLRVFGPESSLLVIVSTTVAVALLLRAARRRGVFLVPAT